MIEKRGYICYNIYEVECEKTNNGNSLTTCKWMFSC